MVTGVEMGAHEFFEVRYRITVGYILTGDMGKEYVKGIICDKFDIGGLSILLAGLCHPERERRMCLSRPVIDERYMFVVRLCISQIKDKLAQGQKLPKQKDNLEETINMKW